VRIIDVPPGEAPEWVRRAWVGLVLPLARTETGPREVESSGVLTGPKSLGDALLRKAMGQMDHVHGYVIEARKAVDILARHAPEAAAWWEEHAPHCLERGRKFIFHAEVCEEVER
jgi:hypothetical protein